jgi:hypothetical protein
MNYNSNFNPEDIYKPGPLYGYENQPTLYNDIDDVDDYTMNIVDENLQNLDFIKGQNNLHAIPSYHLQTMPQMSSIDLLEKDINSLIDPMLCSNDENMGNNELNEEEYINDTDHKFDKQFDTSHVLQNNITKKKVEEVLQDYFVVIDSSDRDVDKYPNPFSYKVYFDSFASTDASITRNFDKVKSITLETAILPTKYYFLKQDVTLSCNDDVLVRSLTDASRNEFFDLTSTDVNGSFALVDVIDSLLDTQYTRKIKFAIKTTHPNIIMSTYEYVFTFDAVNGELPSDVHDSNTTYPSIITKYIMQTFSLMNNKYNLLYLDEFSYTNEYSTNDAVGKSFSIMFPYTTNTNVFYTTCKFKDKVFKFSELGKVNKMTISIRDHNGNQLKNSFASYVDLDVPRTKTCTCVNDADGYLVRDYRCSCSYFRHPHYQHFQNTLIFKISTYEINIDKEIFD